MTKLTMILNIFLHALKKRMATAIKWYIVSLLLVVCSTLTYAQTAHCHADELLLNHLQQTNTEEELADFKESISQHISERGAAEQVDITVVFHIIHQGEPIGSGPNISNHKIFEQLDIVNKDFSFKNSDKVLIPSAFSNLAANAEIQFCLAKEDEYGNPTSGIVRYQKPNINSTGYIDNTIKPQTQWDPLKYMNVWIVRMPKPNILGYAYFPVPSIVGSTKDGVVISHTKFGNVGSSSKGRTLVHEIGHYLGLPHVWGFKENDCSEDDQIQDTPSTFAPYYGCPAYPQITCGTSDMFMNYMDYVNDDCMHMFTEGQKVIMQHILSNQRSGLKNTATTHCNIAVHTNATAKMHDVVTLFPNPCRSEVNITLPENQYIASVRIYDSNGSHIGNAPISSRSTLNELKISTESLESGIYMAQIETNAGNSYVKRFIRLK